MPKYNVDKKGYNSSNKYLDKVADNINPFTYKSSDWVLPPSQGSDRRNYKVNKIVRDIQAIKNPRTIEERQRETAFIEPANNQMLMATPEHMNQQQLNVARSLLSSNSKRDWRKLGHIGAVCNAYGGKFKCNVLPAYAYHKGVGVEPSPYRNKQRGDLLSASMLREVMSDPKKAKKYTDGEVINVPRQIAPYAEGAILSDGSHVGIVSKPYQTISAAALNGLTENTFGFRPENNIDNTKIAYFLPKGTDGTKLLQNAARKYLEARVLPQHNRNWFTPESMAIVNEQKARDLHGNVFIPGYIPVYDKNGGIREYRPLVYSPYTGDSAPIARPLTNAEKSEQRK